MSYAEDVGGRLRRIRVQQGLSLQDVERQSSGRWKAAVVGSYERGDRNISAARMCELADFYGVTPSEILPTDDAPRGLDRDAGVVVDLAALQHLRGEQWVGLRRFLESIQVQRGDFNRQMLSIRNEDLRALAVIAGTTAEGLVDDLRELGCLVER